MASQIEQTNISKWTACRSWGARHIYELICLLILVVGLVFFALHRNYDAAAPIDAGVWGQFGDYVGGIVGSIIAYVSVRLLNKNLQEQVNANIAIKTNNEMNRSVFEQQQFDNAFKTLMELYKDIQSDIKDLNLTNIENYDCKKTEYRYRVDEIVKVYQTFYSEQQKELASYFRLVFRIMQTIDEAAVDYKVKIRYAKLFRCQLSAKELLLLRYNAMTHYGEKMQVYINRYNLLKHLPLLHLPEFGQRNNGGLSAQNESLMDNIFVSIRKYLTETLCKRGEADTTELNSNKFAFGPYRANITFEQNGKHAFKLELSYRKDSTSSMPLDDIQLEKVMKYYLYEIFIFASYERYQKIENITVNGDTSQEKQSKMHKIWASIRHNEKYDLVLSQRQLVNPQG